MSFVSNIVGFTSRSNLPRLGQAFTYNMYVETKSSNDHSFSVILKPMPGYRKFSNVPKGEPQGMYKVSRNREGIQAVYGVWGSRLYLVDEEKRTCYEISQIAGSGRVTFCETTGYGKNHPHLILCDGVNVYAVDTCASVNEQQRDFKTILMPYKYPDAAPTRITPSWVAYMYGYLVVGEENSDIFYYSYQYPFESTDEFGNVDYDIMDAKNTKENGGYGHFAMSEWQPDNTLIGCSNGSRLFTLGTRSFQVFAYQNSKENPLASPDTASQNIGIKNADSLAQFGSEIYWLGSSDGGDGVVFSMGVDASPKRISTDEIESMIRKYDYSSMRCFCFKWEGHPFYVMDFLVDKVTLVYDIKEGGWINMGSGDEQGTPNCFRYSYSAISPSGKLLMQGSDVLVEATDEWWFEHDDSPILRKRAGGILSSDNRPFKVGLIKMLTNTGDYKNVQDRPVEVRMRYSSDGVTFDDVSTYSAGMVGEYDYDVEFRALGKVKYLSVEVGTADNVGFAIYGMDVKGVSCKH